MALLVLIVLLTGSLPALLPKWRHALLIAGALSAALVVTFFYALNDLDAHPSGGDGPAFAILMILFGCAQTIIAASLIGRLIARTLARSLAPSTKRRIAKLLLAFSFVAFALIGTLTALHYPSRGLISITAILLFPFFWLGLALQLAPDNSLKSKPLRDAT